MLCLVFVIRYRFVNRHVSYRVLPRARRVSCCVARALSFLRHREAATGRSHPPHLTTRLVPTGDVAQSEQNKPDYLYMVALSCADVISQLIAVGDLSAARQAALDFSLVRASPTLFAPPSPAHLSGLDKDRADECSTAWRSQVSILLAQPDAFSLLKTARSAPPVYAERLPENCDSDFERVGRCCSTLHSSALEGCPPPACCLLNGGLASPLHLPALREIRLHLRLPATGRVLIIEQDGFLRPFDVSTVYWPAGFLLSQWVGSISVHRLLAMGLRGSSHTDDECESELPRVSNRTLSVVDLGTGIGACALAAAANLGASVMATDVAPTSLAQTTANAAVNGLSEAVTVHKLDWMEDADIESAVAANGGEPFDVVLGAALQFEKWESRLWHVLEKLTHGGRRADGTRALVALAHTTGALPTPPAEAHFEELERVSGVALGFPTRWRSDESDFEVVVLVRRADMPPSKRGPAASTAVAPWAPPLFAFGPEPPHDRRALAATRRLAQLRRRIIKGAEAAGDWVAAPAAMLETARQLDENGFVVLDGLLGDAAAAALHDHARARLSALTSAEAVGRVAGAGAAGRGAAVSAFRSDVSMWARAGSAGSGGGEEPAPLDRLAARLERLVGGLRDGTIDADAKDDAEAGVEAESVTQNGGAGGNARAAAARTIAQLAHVRWRAAEAMLAVYPAGGARYIRHVDNVCTGGVGARCNGRRLTAVYYLADGESEHGDGGFSPGALRIFHAGPPSSEARVDVQPRADRLVLFWADDRVPHAVLPTGPAQSRLAATFWFFCGAEVNRTRTSSSTREVGAAWLVEF